MAAAVAMAFAGQVQAQTIYGAGASAVQKTVKNLVAGKYCSTGTILYYDNATSASTSGPAGTVFRINCTPIAGVSITASTLDVSYDTTGGSWKAFATSNGGNMMPAIQDATLNANPIVTINTAGPCTLTTGYTASFISGGTVYTFSYEYNCPLATLATTDTVTFGLTDVEPFMFDNVVNEPLVANTWSTGGTPSQIFPAVEGGVTINWPESNPTAGLGEKSGFPKPVFGVVFGVAASNGLYTALQNDQLATSATWIPSSCTVGTVSAACAPSITTSQYRSIIGKTAPANKLNNSAAPLFTTAPGTTTLELARRDQGSGTNGGVNAYFLSQGCSVTTALGAPGTEGVSVAQLLPATNLGTNQITYNASTTDVIQRLTLNTATTLGAFPSSGFVIGVVSEENDGSKIAPAGFLKLDGLYPTNTAATAGRYNYMSEENLHGNTNASGDGSQLLADLINASDTFSAINYTGTGIVGTRVTGYAGFAPSILTRSDLCGGSRSK
ncbi:MAG: hypothetical protein JO133_07290 [Burkholderiaceae bacterium]|nr:hypothetical protein [Burkholderiaceae bacterium]